MSYSIDPRKRAVGYVRQGGTQTDAARIFGINRKTLYRWLNASDLTPKRHSPRHRKIDMKALMADVRDYPDAYLRERAALFGVSHQSIWVALRRLNIR